LPKKGKIWTQISSHYILMNSFVKENLAMVRTNENSNDFNISPIALSPSASMKKWEVSLFLYFKP